jgi:hypothetical protein
VTPDDHTNTVADINLEFAHVEFTADGSFDCPTVKKSCLAAKDLYEGYQRDGLTCATVILIDDKQVPSPHRLSVYSVDPLLRMASRFLPVDYITFESHLPRYKDQLLALLDPAHRKLVGRDMEYYARRDGRIACSHDIAIWHLLRLGYFDPVTADVAIPVGALTPRGLPRFTARRAVSVLSRRLNQDDFETLAETTILRYLVVNTVLANIERIYIEDLTMNPTTATSKGAP